MTIAAQMDSFQRHWDDMAEPDCEALEILANAAGMGTEEFISECEKRNADAEREAAFERRWDD